MEQFIDHFLEIFKEYGATIMGFFLAFLMALWRTAKLNGKADWLEAFMCAGLTLGVASLLDFMGFPQSAAIAVGAFVGYMGTHKVSKYIANKFNFEDEEK